MQEREIIYNPVYNVCIRNYELITNLIKKTHKKRMCPAEES